jgi:hypothetical protein
MSDERNFIESEARLLTLLSSLEQIEFAAHTAKGHAYDRRWQRLRVYLIALAKLVRDSLSNMDWLDSYDKSRPPSSM